MRNFTAGLQRYVPAFQRTVGRAIIPLLFLGLALAAAVRFELYVSGRSTLSHDETLTVLFATGNIVAYKDSAKLFSGNWVPAEDWKEIGAISDWKSPLQIAAELGHYGNQPPLYFYLAHVWGHLFGIETLRGLNIILVLCTGAALFGLTRSRFGDTTAAVFTVLLWCLSPEIIRVSAHMRAYELLALIVVLFAWQTIRLIERPDNGRLIDYIPVSILVVLGILANYFMLLSILAGVVGIIVYRRALFWRYGAAIIAGMLSFAAIDPSFYHVAGHDQVFGGTPSIDVYFERVEAIASTVLGFYGWRRSWTSLPIAVFVFGASIVGLVILANYIRRRGGQGSTLVFLLVPAIFMEFSFFFAIVPTHGMLSARYLAPIWPFFAFLHVLILRRYLPGIQKPAIVFLCLAVAPGLLWIAARRSEPPFVHAIANARRVVVDNMATGILFRYVRLAKGDALVFAQNQKALLEDSDKWAKMMKPGDVVISNLSYTGTAKQQEKMIKILKSFHPVKISHSEWGPTVVVVK